MRFDFSSASASRLFALLRLAKPRLSSSLPTRKQNSSPSPSSSSSRRLGPEVTLLAIPVITFGLGCWQVQRRNWKLALIEDLSTRTNAEPVHLPADLNALAEMDYTPIRVRGHFDHSRELVIAPRTRLQHKNPFGGGLFSDSQGNGGHVVTPFVVKGRGVTILVNRGWVSRSHLDPATRAQGQVKGETELVGVLRTTEKRPQFVHENIPERNAWFYRDVVALGQKLGTDPIYIEARRDCSVAGGPEGGQTQVKLRNEHLQYIVTWFSLSVVTSYMWYTRFWRR